MTFPALRPTSAAAPKPTVESLEGRRLLDAAGGLLSMLGGRPAMQDGPIHGGGCGCCGCGAARATAPPPVEFDATPATPPGGEAGLTAAAVERSFKARINFQPSSRASVPTSFRSDNGRVFNTRGNGLQYGWDRPLEGNAVDRPTDRAPGDQYSTFLNVPDGATWEIAVPNGRYYVSFVAGETRDHAGRYRMDVEGVPLMNGKPRPEFEWVEGAGYVVVTDGRLTLTALPESDDLKLDFLTLAQVPDAAPTLTGRPITWSDTQIGVSPIGRIEPGVARLDGKVYVMGGYTTVGSDPYGGVTNRVDVFDTATNTWSRGADLPGPESHFGAATDGRLIYTAGGQVGKADFNSGTNAVYRYYPKAAVWHRYVDLPDVRYAGTLTFHDDHLYFFGGASGNRVVPQADAWRLDTRARDPRWEPIAGLVRPADHLGSAVVDGQIYLVGGEHGHGVSYVQHDDVFRYDPVRDRYTRLASLPTAGASHFEGNIVEHEGQIWVLGGRGNGNTRVTDVRSFDPAANVWTTYAGLPVGRFGGASWVDDGYLYFSTGDVLNQGAPRRTVRAFID